MNHSDLTAGLPRSEWLAVRRAGLGSSDAAAVLGLDNYKTRLDVYNDKMGLKTPGEDNIRMKFGREIEPMLAEWFELKTGLKTRRDNKIRYHSKYDFLMANIDRMVERKREDSQSVTSVLEIKTASDMAVSNWDDEIPINYYCQLQHQLSVTGWEKGFFAMLVVGYSGPKEFKVIEFNRDEDFIAEMQAAEVKFWTEHILKGIPPEPSTDSEIQQVFQYATQGSVVEAATETKQSVNELRILKGEIKELEAKKEEVERRVKLAMGNAETLSYMGETLVTWKNSKDGIRFDKSRFEKENPDLYSQYCYAAPGSRRFLIK